MDRYDLTVRLVIDSEWSYAEPDLWNWRELLLIEPDGRVTVVVVDRSTPVPAPAPASPEWAWLGFNLLHVVWVGSIVVAVLVKS